MVEFPIISIKMKNCKTSYNAQTASRLKEIIQSPSTQRLRLWNKNFLTEISEVYRHLLSKRFLGVKKWCSSNVFFLTPNKNMHTEKFLKSERFLAVLWEHIQWQGS